MSTTSYREHLPMPVLFDTVICIPVNKQNVGFQRQKWPFYGVVRKKYTSMTSCGVAGGTLGFKGEMEGQG